MVHSSFADLQTELEEVSATLRSFTLGQKGVTLRAGADAIKRVQELCERLKEAHPKQSVSIVVPAQNCIKAAQARLDLLKKRSVRA
jgi:hypothetical protein